MVETVFDPNKPYAARCGDKAEILGDFKKHYYGDKYIVRYTDAAGEQYVATVRENGSEFGGRESGSDLVNVKMPRVGYAGLYMGSIAGKSLPIIGPVYGDKSSIPKNWGGGLIMDIISFTWEE
jgi:hypothetical protein